MANGDGEVQRDIDSALEQISTMIEDAVSSDRAYLKSADRLWYADALTRTILILFSVGAPTLVTYASQIPSEALNKGTWMVVAIVATSIAGAATSIQAIWAFGERYKSGLL